MPYLTDVDVSNLLAITLTQAQKDLLNNDVIPAVSKYADEYCNRIFQVNGEQTEVFDGGVNIFFPKYPPVNTINSFKVDGSVYDLANVVVNYKVYIKTQTITGSGLKNVEIKYTSSVMLPADLKHALVRWAAEIFNSSSSAGKDISRFTAGSVTVEYESSGADADNAMPSFVRGVLNRYRLEPA